MIDIKQSIATGWGKGELFPILKQLQDYGFGIQGEVFFVDSYAGSDGNDGLSWANPFKTVAVGITASNAYISAKHYNDRNTIFIKGSFDEDLTTMPQKADIVGVGSTNAEPRARIVGTQAPTDTAWGTRIFGVWFNDDGASATFTLTAGGCQFHNCWFQGVGATVGTYGLYITNPEQVVVKDCIFSSYLDNRFSTAAIALIADGQYNNVLVEGNHIEGVKGIYCTDNALNNHFNATIKNNFIRATTQCIDDNTDDYFIVGNRMITDATMANGADINGLYAVDNIITGSDGSRLVPTTDQEY